MNYSERYAPEELEDFIEILGSESRFWIDSIIGPEMRRTATPLRMVHLEQAMAADDHLAALSAQKRLEMDEPSRG